MFNISTLSDMPKFILSRSGNIRFSIQPDERFDYGNVKFRYLETAGIIVIIFHLFHIFIVLKDCLVKNF